MAMAPTQVGGKKMKKRIAVSQKRQITIPLEYYCALGIEQEVECFLEDNTIVIRPVFDGHGEFDEEILADLIRQGFAGDELLKRFKEMRRNVRPAVEEILQEASLAAKKKGEYCTYEEIFAQGDK
jgi:bifunctional DNA-binding transcriptional regulator/antitoxin component of YhaV-PrlF toxin-antitoxin module